jgi:mRNA interferase MazF
MARGDVLLVGLPETDRREEKGNRPAIAIQTDVANSPMLMVVPITSSLGALRFPFTVKIEPSNLNGLTLSSVAMIFQMRAIDRKRSRIRIFSRS